MFCCVGCGESEVMYCYLGVEEGIGGVGNSAGEMKRGMKRLDNVKKCLTVGGDMRSCQ